MTMKNFLFVFTAATLALLPTGCTKTGVIPMDNGTYTVNKTSYMGYGPAHRLKSAVHNEANDYCVRLGKKMEMISFEIFEDGFSNPSSATLQFKCLDSDQKAPG
jgi:hypothetical protein